MNYWSQWFPMDGNAYEWVNFCVTWAAVLWLAYVVGGAVMTAFIIEPIAKWKSQ